QSALRDGDLKLVLYHEGNTRQLFDLSKDPAEQNDLSKTRKEDADRLEAKLRARLVEAAAKMPKPNPSFDPAYDPSAAPKRGRDERGKSSTKSSS
ncbi:MAG: hypothetical protein JHD00_08420, partial [Akkermansiaceae bacterium]|nr:hypothetical protein [Akkermansiaceae bacterium]